MVCDDTVAMASENEFTIAELSSLADVPVRTIRYYISQGLLPAPGREGPSTRYPAGVLARLRLIKRSRDRHLPLSAIRTELAALTDEEAIELAETPERKPEGSALDYVRSLLATDTTPQPPTSTVRTRSLLKRIDVAPRSPAGPSATPASEAPPAPAAPSATRAMQALAAPAPTSKPAQPPTPERSQWERIVLEPDIELHVRRPLSRPQNRRVERLLAFARELTEGDQP
jgi:DNA-binding transcriptional MerR regulator